LEKKAQKKKLSKKKRAEKGVSLVATSDKATRLDCANF
jgi:hypothetical protein